MKKNILFTLACLISANLFPQLVSAGDDKLDKFVLAMSLDGAAMNSREMQLELALNEEQYQAIAQLNKALYEQIARTEAEFNNDPVLRSRAVRNVIYENDKLLSQVLTEKQLKLYLELEGRDNLGLISNNE